MPIESERFTILLQKPIDLVISSKDCEQLFHGVNLSLMLTDRHAFFSLSVPLE